MAFDYLVAISDEKIIIRGLFRILFKVLDFTWEYSKFWVFQEDTEIE